MTEQLPQGPPARPAVVVADTGPLLCAGAIPRDGIELLHRRFTANGIAIIEPAKVHDELYGHSQGPDPLGIAALRMLNHSRVTVDNRSLRQDVRDVIRQKIEAEIIDRATRRGRTVSLDPDANGGEIDAIMLAKHGNGLLLCNERPARRVAKEMGLTVVTFADLLRAAMADGEIAAADVDHYLQHLPATNFDIGITNPTSVNINSLPRNPAL